VVSIELDRNIAPDDASDSASDTDSNPVDGSRLELQTFIRWIESTIPFLLLLLILFIYQHKTGIFLFIWHSAVANNLNQSLIKQISLRSERKIFTLLGIMLIIVAHISFTYLYFSFLQMWRSLIFLPPLNKDISFWDSIFYIVINDIVIYFATIFVKALVILLFGGLLTNKKRKAQLFTLIESGSQLYRTSLPITIWFAYYTQGEFSQFFSSIIAGLYLIFKSSALISKSKQFIAILKAFMLKEVQYGAYATPEQVATSGDTCSICQEKMKNPLMLHCKHIFCEECVSEWFEREKTCPLCRAVIRSAGNRTHSDGSTYQLIFLF